ncbi:MAG: biotin/lipoyl-containing protein, partial [Bacillota bacterium]|nr:biotin/lipoyl-containing protein [Bacillota bacterium]
YESPDPDSPAFVSVGDHVEKGDTLCIVEAMKLMNEIKSEFTGKVVEIKATNESMVEYGQTLFVIEEE